MAPQIKPRNPPQISGTWFQNSLNCFEVDVLVTDFKSQSFFKSKCFVRFKDMNDLFISLVAIKLLFPAGGWTTTTNCIVYFRCVFIVTFGNVLYIVYICLYILYSVPKLIPFQHFLPNISKIIHVTTVVSKLHIHPLEWKKSNFDVVKHPSIASGSIHNQKKSTMNLQVASHVKSARMTMLKNYARSPENFRMDVKDVRFFSL